MSLRPWVTGLGVLALLTLAVLVVTQQAGVEPLTHMRYPAESAGRMVERHFASLPMLWLMQRHLLRPHGLSLSQAFGLTITDVGKDRFLRG
jgi:hypothetical protein